MSIKDWMNVSLHPFCWAEMDVAERVCRQIPLPDHTWTLRRRMIDGVSAVIL